MYILRRQPQKTQNGRQSQSKELVERLIKSLNSRLKVKKTDHGTKTTSWHRI